MIITLPISFCGFRVWITGQRSNHRSEDIIVGEFFDSLGTFDELVPGEWPRFRGVNFDNIVRDTLKWQNRGIPLALR